MPDGFQPKHKCPDCGAGCYTYDKEIWKCHKCGYASCQLTISGALRVAQHKEMRAWKE